MSNITVGDADGLVALVDDKDANHKKALSAFEMKKLKEKLALDLKKPFLKKIQFLIA